MHTRISVQCKWNTLNRIVFLGGVLQSHAVLLSKHSTSNIFFFDRMENKLFFEVFLFWFRCPKIQCLERTTHAVGDKSMRTQNIGSYVPNNAIVHPFFESHFIHQRSSGCFWFFFLFQFYLGWLLSFLLQVVITLERKKYPSNGCTHKIEMQITKA